MLRVCVTGGSGYIGSVLCDRLLACGHKVIALDNLLYRQSTLLHLCNNPDFDFVRGDVRDRAALAPILGRSDVIIHLAALVGAPACDNDPFYAKSVNFEASVLLNALRSRDQLLIYPTTNSGYGTKSGDVLCTEETPLEPISLYGHTKSDAERAILQKENAITLRLATVFGTSPRMRYDLLVNHFVLAALTEKSIVIFEKDFKRNFVHIRDVADCFCHCIEHGGAMAGKPYNLGLDSANMSKGELALAIKGAIPDFNIIFSDIGTDPDKRNYIVSSRRLKDAGFEARRSLAEGIGELIKGVRMIDKGPYRNA
ncbi:MAG TPA: NAD(P)-dependent oxidoreductase [Candidatus Deferrimicrobiaceae bacterium]|jgi:nucleoside-diphosphate-sugar epimerase